VIGGAELVGDDLEGQAFDEEGTQGGIAAMQRLLGLEEKTLAGGVVHDANSAVRVTFNGATILYGRRRAGPPPEGKGGPRLEKRVFPARHAWCGDPPQR
jgi:hypothetical protein